MGVTKIAIKNATDLGLSYSLAWGTRMGLYYPNPKFQRLIRSGKIFMVISVEGPKREDFVCRWRAEARQMQGNMLGNEENMLGNSC